MIQVRGRIAARAAVTAAILCGAACLRARAQQGINVSPQEAESHLVKKVAPVYPAFAKAAGVQGTVTIDVGIGPTGRISVIEGEVGPPSLLQAAQHALSRHVYKPFKEGDRAVEAYTKVQIVFKLPGNVPPPPSPPAISAASFTLLERGGYCEACLQNVSAQLRKWLAADLKKTVVGMEDGSDASPEFLSIEKALNDETAPLPEEIEMIQVPIEKRGEHLYLLRQHLRILCGASGNCPAELVEEDASGIRRVLSMGGGAFYIVPRRGSPYPDIFTYWHMSAFEGDVAGYSNFDGLWGQIYCGEIKWSEDQTNETDDIKVCQ